MLTPVKMAGKMSAKIIGGVKIREVPVFGTGDTDIHVTVPVYRVRLATYKIQIYSGVRKPIGE
jgi:hypothetical protein